MSFLFYMFVNAVLKRLTQSVINMLKEVIIMANVNIRIDEELKKEAETIFNELGLTPTAAITLFYKQVVRTYSIPFELKLDVPNKETVDAIKEVRSYEEKHGESKKYNSVNEMIRDLK